MNDNPSVIEIYFESVLEAVEKEGPSDENAAKLFESLLERAPHDLLASFKGAAPEMLEAEQREKAAFKARNYSRWKQPLDLLLMLWRICQELGEKHSHAGPQDSDVIVFDTLAHLQPRALPIVSEIMCLLEGGFADGALTRWRSLHEVVVTAMFIAKHGHKAAFPYRLSVWFAGARRAANYNEHAVRAGLAPIDAKDLSDIQAMRDTAEMQLGRILKGDWDWAAEALGKREPNFADLEKDVGLDHWRPRFKWACQHIHAGFVHPNKLLGMSEAEVFAFQVGPSNSGLVDPIHMAAISLMQMTISFLFFPEPSLDSTVLGKMLQILVDEIGDVALETQNRSLREARREAAKD